MADDDELGQTMRLMSALVKMKPKPHEETVSEYIDSRVGATREHIADLAAAVPDLPNEFEQGVGLLQAEIPTRGTVLLLVVVFAALGFGVEWLFRKATQKIRQRLDGLLLGRQGGDRFCRGRLPRRH